MVQLSHLYMTTGKTIVLTIWTLVGSDFFFLIHYVCQCPPSKQQVYFDFVAAVTIHSDSGAQENKNLFYIVLIIYLHQALYLSDLG